MDRVEKNNHISILDDDCLIEIFSYMNYEDICNIEQGNIAHFSNFLSVI